MNVKMIKEQLKLFSTIWQRELNIEYLYPKTNVRYAFSSIGGIGEHLASAINNGFQGTGSGGMGYDLINLKTNPKKQIEVKTTCTIQNSNCDNCKFKFNDIINNVCPICNHTNFSKIKDSRFSINAKSLLDNYNLGNFENLTFCHISEDETYRNNTEIKIILEWYILDFKNKKIKDIQLEYFKNQVSKGKKDTANLLPNSYDFFKLSPNKILKSDIIIDYANLNKSTIVNIIIPKNELLISEDILRKKEIKIFRTLKSYNPKTKTANSIDFTMNMDYRNKSLGKDRGDTQTTQQNKLK